MIQTLEYCALHYLNQWLDKDSRYCHSLESADVEQQRKALIQAGGFYKVGRNLRTEHEKKIGAQRYDPLLDLLHRAKREQYDKAPAKSVERFQKKLSDRYGNRNVLSATSKFLWLKFKHPIIIYDSRARMALGCKRDCKYAVYYDKWKTDYANHSGKICAACSCLPKLRPYAINGETITESQIKEITTQLWFRERVFDIYLWFKASTSSPG